MYCFNFFRNQLWQHLVSYNSFRNMNMWLLDVAICEKCRSSHSLSEWGSKRFEYLAGGGGVKIFRIGGYRFGGGGYFCSIQKVLEQLWKYFTFLKLCKCSWMLHPLPTVASTPIGTKTNHHWFYHLQVLHTH